MPRTPLSSAVAVIAASLLLSACWTSKSPAPTIKYSQLEGARSTGAHTVAPGDTVGGIAERYRLEIRDIITANNLDAPYALQPGQRLLLPPPRTYTVRHGDTVYGVSRMFNISTTQIARLNTLHAPYVLQYGMVLKLPAVADAPVPAAQPVSLISRPQAMQPGGIEREELAPPSVSGHAIPAPAPQIANASMRARIPDATPPRAGGKFMMPVQGAILSSYGPKPGGLHNDGINIKAPRGAPVRVAENGVVVYVGDMRGYGNMVLVRHADRWVTAYAHLDRIHATRGQTVSRGDTVGTVGSTGSVTEPQLHFEIRRGRDALNPEKYM